MEKKKKINMRDIARIADVTPGTVSKVINNYTDISEATKQKVLQVIEEYQYKPASGSRAALNYGSKPKIGFIIEGVYNPITSEMEEIATARLHNAAYTMLTYHDNYFTQDKEEKFHEIIDYAKNNCLKCIVYLGGNFKEISKKLFDKLPCPTIFVNTVLPVSFEKTNYSSIQCNNFETAKYQMERLISNGHKKIAMLITSDDDNSIYGQRFDGYRAALNEHGLTGCLDYVIEGQYVFDNTYDRTKKLLVKNPEITSIACSADVMVPAALRAINDLGKKVGEDMELLSFDGLEMMNYCIPSVSTFRQPKKEMVDAIYDQLIGIISGEKQHQHITFQNELILRESAR